MIELSRPKILWLLSTMIFFVSMVNGPVYAREDITSSNSQRMIFGVAPFMSPLALVKRMAPLRTYLSDSMGVEIIIETTTNANEFSKRTLSGHYDFVLTNPTFSLIALDKADFQIVATQKNKLSGYFVVLETSDIKDIRSLSGKRIGAPPKVGFMGQLIEPYLRNNVFTDTKMPVIKYFHSHNDAISALRLGETDATLIVSFMEHHLRIKGVPIRTIHSTESYPGMTILATNKVSAQHVNTLRKSLFELDRNEEGRDVLKQISMSGFEELNRTELEKVRPYLPEN